MLVSTCRSLLKGPCQKSADFSPATVAFPGPFPFSWRVLPFPFFEVVCFLKSSEVPFHDSRVWDFTPGGFSSLRLPLQDDGPFFVSSFFFMACWAPDGFFPLVPCTAGASAIRDLFHITVFLFFFLASISSPFGFPFFFFLFSFFYFLWLKWLELFLLFAVGDHPSFLTQ